MFHFVSCWETKWMSGPRLVDQTARLYEFFWRRTCRRIIWYERWIGSSTLAGSAVTWSRSTATPGAYRSIPT